MANPADGDTLFAVAWPILFIVITTVTGELISTGDGDTTSDDVRLAGVWINTDDVACTAVFTVVPELLSVPAAAVVNTTLPAPAALYVHVKYALAPGAIESTGVATIFGVTFPLPLITGVIGVTLSAAAWPLFVTDSTTCIV
jgi:hypothetical protein